MTKVDSLDDSLRECDFLSVHMPLNSKTKNLINFQNLKKMKKTSIIINTARDIIINELDLHKALNENIIFGAGLDVLKMNQSKKIIHY